MEFDLVDVLWISDPEQRRKFMDRHEEFQSALFGNNESEELVMVSINKDCIVTSTFQKNRWVRKNIYWRDGTIEETFEGRWDRVPATS